MKNLKKIAFIIPFVVGFLFVSCTADSDTLTGNAELGGLLDVKKLAITYVVGNGQDKMYDNQIGIYQGNEKVTKIDIYRTFTTVKLGADGTILKDVKGKDSIVPITSNKLFLKTISVAATEQLENYSYSTNYNELSAGLVIADKPLSALDSGLRIGDFFELTYVSTLNNGKIHENFAKTKVAIGTRFAGTYKVIQAIYWRIGIMSTPTPWVDTERTIESVDATTYRFLRYAGPFVSDANTHYFTISGPLDTVNTPSTYLGAVQLQNGQPTTNCVENPALMVNACNFAGLQNVVVRDDVNGRDIIYRSYGYNTAATPTTTPGPREFYEVLEKIVD